MLTGDVLWSLFDIGRDSNKRSTHTSCCTWQVTYHHSAHRHDTKSTKGLDLYMSCLAGVVYRDLA